MSLGFDDLQLDPKLLQALRKKQHQPVCKQPASLKLCPAKTLLPKPGQALARLWPTFYQLCIVYLLDHMDLLAGKLWC